jgi:hypothetical protein
LIGISWDVATWTALGTWVLVIGTLVLMYWQTHQAGRLNSANAVIALRERFDSTRMLKARRDLSKHLIHGEHEEITNVEVATFFELVGALTHQKVLDEELVWEAFGTWVANYYWALRHPVDLIARSRQELRDPLVFHEFEWLFERVMRIDKKMAGHVPSAPASAPSFESREMLSIEAEIELD